MGSPTPSTLRELVRRYLGDNPAEDKKQLKEVLVPLQRTGWPVYLFGGVPRDLMRSGGRARPRDIDLVVDGAVVDDIASVFTVGTITKNRFGGLRIHAKGWAIDAWSVRETWAFSQRRFPSTGSAAELPLTTFLNVEAVVVELWPREEWSRRVYHRGFFEAFSNRVVELNFSDNPYPEFAILRSLLVAYKLKFRVGPRLAEYIRSRLELDAYRRLLELNRQHYPTKIVAPAVLHDWMKAVIEAPAGEAVQLPYVNYQTGARSRQGDLFEGYQHSLWPHLTTGSYRGAKGWVY